MKKTIVTFLTMAFLAAIPVLSQAGINVGGSYDGRFLCGKHEICIPSLLKIGCVAGARIRAKADARRSCLEQNGVPGIVLDIQSEISESGKDGDFTFVSCGASAVIRCY
jgi:hypothetical protein